MIATLRISGFLMMVLGLVIAATWLIEPLRLIWPWLLNLPLAVQLGLGIAAVGVILLFATVLAERLGNRDQDDALREDDWLQK